MTQIRKLTILFLLFSFNFLWGQESSTTLSLRQVFEALEKQYSCTFAYKDIDLENHFAVIPDASNLENAIQTLESSTIFNFSILQDNTIAVNKKSGLIRRCVTIINNELNIPFENVSVITPYQQLATGKNGIISFELSGPEQTIVISFNGFETVSLTANSLPENDCLDIRLNRKLELLSTVNLLNYLAKGITKNSNGSLNVNYQEFDILPGLIEPDVLQTIQALPGIQSVNETVSFINIRGGSNDQNLILLDGVKMYQSGHFFGLISAFNPFLTNEVNIIKNGSSAEYGDGVSGIISMEGTNSTASDAKVGWGINLISTDAFVELPLGDKTSIQIAGRKSFNNLVQTPTYTSYFDKAFQNTEVVRSNDVEQASNDDFTFYDAHLRVLFQPTPRDFIRASFLLMGNNLNFLENATIQDERQSRRSELQQGNIAGGIYYRRDWNSNFSSDIQLYGTNYDLSATNFDILNDQRLMQENEVLESGAKVRALYSFSEVLQLNAGYQFNETGITNFEQINNPFFERTDKQVLRTNSLFSEVIFQPKNWNTTIIAGMRVNHIDKFNEFLPEPRLAINYRFLNYFSIDLAGELKSQTTSQIIDFQNDFLGVENRRWVLSREDDIPIMKGQQFSVGLNFSRSGWLVNVEPYIKKIEGITTQSQGFQNQFENVRTHGSYTVQGVDFLLNKRFRDVNTWLSYSFAENNYTFEELSPSKFPNNIDIRHSLTYGLSCTLNKFKVSGGFNWHSGKPVTTLVAGSQVIDGELSYNAPNQENIDDYIRVDISGTYTFSLGKKVIGFAGISFWNILDTKNVLNKFYIVNGDDEPELVTENSLSFTPNATLRLSF